MVPGARLNSLPKPSVSLSNEGSFHWLRRDCWLWNDCSFITYHGKKKELMGYSITTYDDYVRKPEEIYLGFFNVKILKIWDSTHGVVHVLFEIVLIRRLLGHVLHIQSLLRLDLVLQVADLLFRLGELNRYVEHSWVALLSRCHSMLLRQVLQHLEFFFFL